MSLRVPLVAIVTATFLAGLLNVLITGKLPVPPPWRLVEQVLLFSLAYWWYHLDKRKRTFRAGPLQNIFVVFVPVVAIPVYLFRSRGLRQGTASFLMFLGFCAMALVALIAGATLAHLLAP